MGGWTSPSHWVVILLILVLLFGAKKIPELAKSMGKGIKNFRDEMGADEAEKTATKIEKKDENSFEQSEQDFKHTQAQNQEQNKK